MFLGTSLLLLNACASRYYVVTQGVAYRSFQSTSGTNMESEIPDSAKIIVKYWFSSPEIHCQQNGCLSVAIQNNTDEIMVIDKTKSFFRNENGVSTAYWDPEVKTHTTSTTNGGSSGISVNLGSVTGLRALSGVNVGGGTSSATTDVNTTYDVDQPTISIAPHSEMNIGRYFYIDEASLWAQLAVMIGEQKNSLTIMNFTPKNSNLKFGVSVTYSLDNGQTYDRIDNDFYANTLIISRPRQDGQFNDAVREIYVRKPDALQETCYQMLFRANHPKDLLTSPLVENSKYYYYGTFYNYK